MSTQLKAGQLWKTTGTDLDGSSCEYYYLVLRKEQDNFEDNIWLVQTFPYFRFHFWPSDIMGFDVGDELFSDPVDDEDTGLMQKEIQ